MWRKSVTDAPFLSAVSSDTSLCPNRHVFRAPSAVSRRREQVAQNLEEIVLMKPTAPGQWGAEYSSAVECPAPEWGVLPTGCRSGNAALRLRRVSADVTTLASDQPLPVKGMNSMKRT